MATKRYFQFYTRVTLFVFSLLSLIHFAKGQPYDNEILDYQREVFYEDGTIRAIESYTIQINNKDGEWASDVAIDYKEGNEPKILEAAIYSLSGEELRKLKKKEIATRSAYTEYFHEDNLVKAFELKWSSYPHILKYSYQKKYNDFLSLANWAPIQYLSTPTNHASLSVTVPTDLKVTISADERLQYMDSVWEDKKFHRWEISNIGTFKKELFAPPQSEVSPWVKIQPKSFYYGVPGQSDSWQSYGKWQYDLNKGLNELPLTEKTRIDQLIAGIEDKKEIVRTLYHYLQDNTRYIYVELGVGGLQPFPASSVCKNKYGDCKGLTNYMKAMLDYVGIKSNYTKIFAGENPVRLNTNFISPHSNHVFLMVPFEKDTIWLENTSNVAPFGYLGTFTQDRWALAVSESNSQLVKTPALSLQDVLSIKNYQMQLSADGSGSFLLNATLKDENFSNFIYYKKNGTKEDRKKYLKQWLPLSKSTISEWSINQRDRDDLEVTISLEGSTQKKIRKIGNILAMEQPSLNLPKLERPEKRVNAIRVNFPINQIDSIHYDLAMLAGYSLDESVPEVDIQSKFGSYTQRHFQENDVVVSVRHYQLFKGDYPKSDYADFYQFFKDIKKQNRKSPVLLNPKQ